MNEKSRAQIYSSFKKKKDKAKNLAPGRTGTNTVDKAGRENYAKPGHKGWKIERPPQKKTPPKHPGVLSYPTSTRPAGTADPGRGKPGLHLPQAKTDRRIKKLTVGFGKDKAGKSLGQTTIVDVGLNPSSARKIKGATMARNQLSKRGTAPQAKAPAGPKPKGPSVASVMKKNMPRTPKFKAINVGEAVGKHQRLSPHLSGEAKTTPVYVWKPGSNPHMKDQKKSFSATKIAAAIGGATLATAGAITLHQQATNTPRPKRNKGAAVTTAKARNSFDPVKNRVDAILNTAKQPGAAAQASPKLKAASDARRAAEGTKLRHAGYGKPAKPAKPAAAPKPRSILELEEPKPVTTSPPKAAEAPKPVTTPVQRAAPERARPRVRDLFRGADWHTEQAEIAASRGVAPRGPEHEAIRTPVDAEEVKPEGRVKRTAKAPGRAVTATTKATGRVASTVASTVADIANPTRITERAEAQASRTAIVTPVDPAPAGEFEGLSPDQRVARKKDLEARIETGRARQGAAAAKRKKAGEPVKATPEEVEGVKQRDVLRAQNEAERLRADIHKAEAAPNVKSEQKLETTPDERRGGEQRVAGRRGPDRQTKRGATTESRARTIGPKAGTRRQRGSDRRSVQEAAQKKVDAAAKHYADLESAAAKSKAATPPKPPKSPKMAPTPTSVSISDRIAEGNRKATAKAPAIDTKLAKKLETARELNAKLKAKKEGTTYSGRPSRHDPAKVVTPKPPVPKKAAPKVAGKPVKHPLGPDPVAVKNAAQYTAVAENRRTRRTTRPGGARSTDPAMTPSETAGVKAVTNPAAVAKKKQAALARLPERPLDALGIVAGQPGKALAEAEIRAAELRAVIDTAEKTSQSATSAEDTRVAASAASEAKRKKAAQKFYNEKSKRIEAQGSVRQGTSTAVNPAVVGAQPKEVAVTAPPTEKRRPTEELIREQGIEVQKVPKQKAPETDAVSEEWEKRAKNTAATTTPMERAIANAEELKLVISEAEAKRNTIGEKLAQAAKPGDTLTADVAKFQGDRIVSSLLNNEGEFETRILEGEDLKQTVADANEDLRKGGDRRAGATTRRNFADRSTAAEASILVEGSERKTVGLKKGSRREKQAGGDQRQKGSTWKPVDIGEELANQRPGGLPERRAPAWMESMNVEDVGELKDAAVRGDPVATETLRQYRAALAGKGKGRREIDIAERTVGRAARDIEFAEQGLGKVESTSVWDPKARRRVPGPMDVEADLMPKVQVYTGDPVKANTLERMDKRISDLEKRLSAPGAGKLHKGQETLEKLKRQRAGVAQDTNLPGARQFPKVESPRAEGSVVPGEKIIPRTEARKHVRGPEGRRDVLVEGDPQQRKTAPPREPITEPRTRPHVGPERGSTVRPSPDLTVQRSSSSAVKEALARAARTPRVTNPAVGAHVGENIRNIKGGLGKAGAAAITLAGLFGASEASAAFANSEAKSVRDKLSEAGGVALEGFLEAGKGIAGFSASMLGAEAGIRTPLKGTAGAVARAGGTAAKFAGEKAIAGVVVPYTGYQVGKLFGQLTGTAQAEQARQERLRKRSEKRYGTPELAAATRRRREAGYQPMTEEQEMAYARVLAERELQKQAKAKFEKQHGRTLTLDDTEEIARRWERESAKLNKR